MINFDDVTKLNIKGSNENWLQTLDHPYRIQITSGSGSDETWSVGLKNCNDFKMFFEYLNDINNVDENIDE